MIDLFAIRFIEYWLFSTFTAMNGRWCMLFAYVTFANVTDLFYFSGFWIRADMTMTFYAFFRWSRWSRWSWMVWIVHDFTNHLLLWLWQIYWASSNSHPEHRFYLHHLGLWQRQFHAQSICAHLLSVTFFCQNTYKMQWKLFETKFKNIFDSILAKSIPLNPSDCKKCEKLIKKIFSLKSAEVQLFQCNNK